MQPNDLRRQLDALGSEPTDVERRIRAAASRGRLWAMEAPGHVIDAVAAVSRRGGAVDARTLARLLNVTPAAAGARLQRAARLGLLRRVGRGQYAVGT